MDRAAVGCGRRGFFANESALIRAFAIAVSAVALAGASACGRPVSSGPPELRLGVDACDGCGMAISEPRYAAAVLAEDGPERKVLKFDDVGCLARWEAGAQSSTVRGRWVHDRTSGAWIVAATATYVQARDLITPMGSALAAFATRSDAEALVAERGGEVLSWDAILARARDGSLKAEAEAQREEAR